MKKKTFWALLVCMLFILAACASNTANTSMPPAGNSGGNKSEAYATYTQLMNKLSPAPGEDAQFDMDMETDMTIEAGGESMSMNVSGNVKMIIEDGEIQYSMVMDMGELGGVVEMAISGGHSYYAINGVELDLDMLGMDIDMLMEQANPVNMPDFELDAIKSVVTESVSGGEKTTIVIDGPMLSDYSFDAIGGMTGGFDQMDYDMKMDDVVMDIIIGHDGNPKSMVMKTKMEMTYEGESMKTDMTVKMDFNKLGGGVVINLP